MKKRLVYYFFFYRDWCENPIYEIHFNCLEYYKNCFDEVYFALAFEDPSDEETIKEVKHRLIDIFSGIKKIEFEIVVNDANLCECPTFKKEVVDRLGEDDLVFFAHSKGVMDIKNQRTDVNAYKWVCALYHFSLNFQREMEENLIKTPNEISYGSLMIQYIYEPHVNSIYEWHYSGTFFWINSKRLKEYITINRVELPDMCDRFYAENFLSNIYPMYAVYKDYRLSLATSHCQGYTFSYSANWPDLELSYEYSCLDAGDKENFNEFIKKMTEKKK